MTFLGLQGAIPFVLSHKNGWGITMYSFTKRAESRAKYFHFERNYGGHDWIAEYALRIIQDSGYKSHISGWLYDDTLDIPYKDLDPLRKGDAYSAASWWHPDMYSAHTSIFKGDSLSETRYLFARRFFNFLYGTLWPDTMPKALIIYGDTELCSELFYTNEDWMKKDDHHNPHSIFFSREDPTLPSDYYSNKYIPSRYLGDNKGLSAELCQLAALTAIYCLNVEQPFTYSDNGEEVSSSWTGKYEAAAMAIGAMTHFIADVSVPFHTIHKTSSFHGKWEEYCMYELLMKFDKEVGNGVPCKDVMDPNDLISSENLQLKPMIPYQAAIAMAEKTFMACDEDINKDVYAYDANSGSEPYLCAPYLIKKDLTATSQPYHSDIVERAKKLCCYAVYYTACAILWVCELAKMNERTKATTTSERLINVKGDKIKHPTAVSIEQIKDWGRLSFKFPGADVPVPGLDERLAAAWAQSFSMALFVFVPIVALTTVLILQEVITVRRLEDPLVV